MMELSELRASKTRSGSRCALGMQATQAHWPWRNDHGPGLADPEAAIGGKRLPPFDSVDAASAYGAIVNRYVDNCVDAAFTSSRQKWNGLNDRWSSDRLPRAACSRPRNSWSRYLTAINAKG